MFVHCSNIKSYILNLNTYSKFPLECIINGYDPPLFILSGMKITGNGGGDREECWPFHTETIRRKTSGTLSFSCYYFCVRGSGCI